MCKIIVTKQIIKSSVNTVTYDKHKIYLAMCSLLVHSKQDEIERNYEITRSWKMAFYYYIKINYSFYNKKSA